MTALDVEQGDPTAGADGITYVHGNACKHWGDAPAIIAHVCNDQGGWGRGFVLAISGRWPEPKLQYRSWANEQWPENLPLGEIQMVPVQQAPQRPLWVANMIAQAGYVGRGRSIALRYDALEWALKRLADRALDLGAQVHMPRIGCGLAGGTWDQVQPLIQRLLVQAGVSCTVYDLSTTPS